jgi:hypothetical protein
MVSRLLGRPQVTPRDSMRTGLRGELDGMPANGQTRSLRSASFAEVHVLPMNLQRRILGLLSPLPR